MFFVKVFNKLKKILYYQNELPNICILKYYFLNNQVTKSLTFLLISPILIITNISLLFKQITVFEWLIL